jgi:O-antigen ligase
MKRLDAVLKWAGFGLTAVAVFAAPWFFGAWEMWWFWLFAVMIFGATACFTVRLLLTPALGRGRFHVSSPLLTAAAVCLPFLAYAFVRFLQARVFMDAERSFLLFLTPVLLAFSLTASLSARQWRIWTALLAADFLLLGGYGIVNHFVWQDAKVMWMPGFPQYVQAHRATGSYYCPDHFAGVMELALSVGLAAVLARGKQPVWRTTGALLCAVALLGILLSKSRGAGVVAGSMLLVTAGIGLMPYPSAARWTVRGALILVLLAVAAFVLWAPHSYARRFREYPWQRLQDSDRVIMAQGALRAWQSSPSAIVFGIGPGMHQHLWPRFAASADGDAAAGRWPSRLNTSFHSYQVHSDWIQLLEEYGLVGFALFLAAAGYVMNVLFRGWRRYCARVLGRGPEQAPDDAFRERGAKPARSHGWPLLAGLLALTALAIHSLGDFNLQMPATVWLLAALTADALAAAARKS